MAIQTLNNNVALLEQRTKINANFSELDTRATTAQTTADSAATTAGNASTAAGLKYTKPGPGIPSSDMTTAVQSSLAKADSAVQPAGLTKAAVGLGNADNTSDADKPVSTATAAALLLKGDAPLIVPITAPTTLDVDLHNGNILRLDASRTLEVPEGLGTSYSCLVQIPIGQTLTADPTGTVEFIDTTTPAGSAATRTRTQANNPNGVVIQSTGVANKLTISGS